MRAPLYFLPAYALVGAVIATCLAIGWAWDGCCVLIDHLRPRGSDRATLQPRLSIVSRTTAENLR